jgi:SRSO17 transposase
VVFKTKSQLSLDITRHARSLGIRYAWVGVDVGYGKEPQFLNTLDEKGEQFVADVHKDQTIYLEDPAPYVPQRRSSKGRAPSRHKTDATKTTVAAWAASQPKEAWQRLRIRDSSKGRLEVDLLTRRVWVWLDKKQNVRRWHLVIRREVCARDNVKYSLSNAPAETPLKRLAFMQGQRYFVERSFQDAKGSAGMDHYQIRGWRAWHHHMALVMMSMLFMLETRTKQKESYPLLSCPDIVTLLAHFLPRRDVHPKEVLRQMEVRHRQRQASIDSAYARQELANVTK